MPLAALALSGLAITGAQEGLKGSLFQAVFQFLKMVKDIRIKIKLMRVRKSLACDAFYVSQCDKVPSNKKNDVFNICIQAAIQFAKGNAVWVGNIDVQVTKLTNMDITLLTSLGQRNKTIQRNRLNMDFQFPGNLHNGSVQFVGMYIVTNKININGQPRTSQQCQSAPSN